LWKTGGQNSRYRRGQASAMLMLAENLPLRETNLNGPPAADCIQPFPLISRA